MPNLHIALVHLAQGQPVTSSQAIADGTQYPHKSVIQLVRQHRADLEEFGRLAFEMRTLKTPGGTQQREVALLNEPQATLLLTYMRNSAIVKQFKKALVKAFFELRQRQSAPAAPEAISISKDEYIELLRAKVQCLEGTPAAGLPRPKRPNYPPLTAAERARIRALAAQGLSNGAIARQTGRSNATISLLAREVREGKA